MSRSRTSFRIRTFRTFLMVLMTFMSSSLIGLMSFVKGFNHPDELRYILILEHELKVLKLRYPASGDLVFLCGK